MKRQLEIRKRLGVKYVKIHRAAAQTREENVLSPKEALPASSDKRAGARVATTPDSPGPRDPAPRESRVITDGTEPAWCLGSGAKADALRAFRGEIQGCQKCPLGKTRKNFVFGMGNPEARVLFIGEAPGADEDAQGLPFVGRAGQLLTKIIASTKTWTREEVFIANVLKCRPPNNRPPQPEEVAECLPYLKRQIAILKPVLIMALGTSAAQALLNTKIAVGKLRNQWHDIEGVPMLVTYHPAALLRSDLYKKDVWADMKKFTAKYRELNPS